MSSCERSRPTHQGDLENIMRSQGMIRGENYWELLTRLSTALAMPEAAYVEVKRRRG